MENIALIGIALGKHSFHVHCQDKSGKALLRKKFTRTKLMQFLATCPSAVVVMEACAVRILWRGVSAILAIKQNVSLRNSWVVTPN
ncbi:hypothetical protein KB20921_20970 [Edwardsiella ictaluri]|nr:Uncharacterised protein [Edwardsiella ictaluri]BEH99346.1 hypothetical protein KH20906_20740 [Edwardsiella ictaluri]BEI02836.1 hypothetical protein KB20921_20970 [Edwardsiella ictaluri]BEI06298.1 hypothetical protein KH201010_20840 [Edwardsiella ictaluri]BEI09760.1 hypothetical protein STU22726_20910 [Edwardsiella ictaluri]